MKMSGLRIVIFSKDKDTRFEQVVKEATIGCKVESIRHADALAYYGSATTPRMADIHIYLDAPCRAAWLWAKRNIVVANPEWWPARAWNWVLEKEGADLVVFKSARDRSLFPELEEKEKRVRVIPWRAFPSPSPSPKKNECLYIPHSLRAAITVCGLWKPEWPRMLLVVKDPAEQEQLRKDVPEYAERGIVIQTELPKDSYLYQIGGTEFEGCVHTKGVGSESDLFRDPGDRKDFVNRVEAMWTQTEQGTLLSQAERKKEFRAQWKSILSKPFKANAKAKTTTLLPPKPLSIADLPTVAIVTLTRNRPRWFANMARNILLCEYPPDKLTWIVADDGDGNGRIDKEMMKFQSDHPQLSVKYLSMPRPLAIGAKRNKACEVATSSVMLMMDDDDHYPPSSIAARVAWLVATGKDCVYCSTLPMYHCGKYISAMNVPPLHLAPEERVSEATLTFKREFWEARRFPDTNMSEGEGFLSGRIGNTAEIPPEGIIVSFLHGANVSSRKVPDMEANGCHYGFDDDFFTYLSGLA